MASEAATNLAPKAANPHLLPQIRASDTASLLVELALPADLRIPHVSDCRMPSLQSL